MPDLRGPTQVLLVDDDEGIVESLSDVLQEKGYLVQPAFTAQQGLDALRNGFVNLALLDLRLPDRSGLELLEDLKVLSPKTEAVMITAYATVQSAIQAMDKGAFGFVTKPVEMDHLLSTMQRALERQRLRHDLDRRHRQLSALYQVATAVSASWDPDVTLASALDRLLEVTRAEMGMVRLLENSSGSLVLKAHRDAPKSLVQGLQRRSVDEDPIAQRLFADGQNVLFEDLSGDDSEDGAPYREAGIRSLLAAPVVWQGKPWGTLEIASYQPNRFDGQDRDLVTTLGEQMGVAIEKARAYEDLKDLSVDAITALVATVEAKDPYTRGHSMDVAQSVVALGRQLGLPHQDRERLRLAALLHDIGKIGIPDAVLHKPGPLNDEEWQLVRAHPGKGAEIVSNIRGLRGLVSIIRGHHERFDGTGYPDGLTGEEIPRGARMMAVADAFDAMTSPRPYRPAFNREQAQQILREGAGSQWDAELVSAFLQIRIIGGEGPWPGSGETG